MEAKRTSSLLSFCDDRNTKAINLFYQSPNTIEIGKNKIRYPISIQHLVLESKMFSIFDDGNFPSHILTKFDIRDNDLIFEFVWLMTNRCLSLDFILFDKLISSQEDYYLFKSYVDYLHLDCEYTLDTVCEPLNRKWNSKKKKTVYYS